MSRRILAAKERAGLFTDRYVKLDEITERLDATKLDTLAESVAERALTLVKDDRHLFPLPANSVPCLVVLGEGSFSTRGETLARELARRAPSLQVFPATSTMPDSSAFRATPPKHPLASRFMLRHLSRLRPIAAAWISRAA